MQHFPKECSLEYYRQTPEEEEEVEEYDDVIEIDPPAPSPFRFLAPAFNPQGNIFFNNIENHEYEPTAENLSQCVMRFPDNTIVIMSKLNNAIDFNGRSYEMFSKETQNLPFIPIINSLPITNSFDLMGGMFRGIQPPTTQHGDLTPVFELLKALCTGDEEDYDFLLNHIAHMFQKPQERTDIAVLIFGPDGTGKGLLYNLLAACLHPYTHKVVGFDKFKSYLNQSVYCATKILITIDECHKIPEKDLQILKNCITNTTDNLTLRKGGNPTPVNVYYRLFIYSNSTEVIKLIPSSKRYFALHPLFDDKPFYSRIARTLYLPNVTPDTVDPKIASAFTQFMLRRDIRNYNPHQTLITAFQEDLTLANLPRDERIIIMFIRKHRQYCSQEHTSKDLFNLYQKYVKNNNIREAETEPAKLGELFRKTWFTVRLQKSTRTKWYKLQPGYETNPLIN